MVEDDLEIGSWMQEKLKSLDNVGSFRWTTSISETLEILEDQLPDLMILDLKLPDGNGINLLQAIRMRKLHVKVVVFSINSGMKNACLRQGAVAFFDKSNGSEDLIYAIDNSIF